MLALNNIDARETFKKPQCNQTPTKDPTKKLKQNI